MVFFAIIPVFFSDFWLYVLILFFSTDTCMVFVVIAFLPVLWCTFVETYKSPGTGVWYRSLAEVDYLINFIMKRERS